MFPIKDCESDLLATPFMLNLKVNVKDNFNDNVAPIVRNTFFYVYNLGSVLELVSYRSKFAEIYISVT